MAFPTSSTSLDFPHLDSTWHPYQGVSPSYNVPIDTIPILEGGYPPYTLKK